MMVGQVATGMQRQKKVSWLIRVKSESKNVTA
jgi:hypothetical protein